MSDTDKAVELHIKAKPDSARALALWKMIVAAYEAGGAEKLGEELDELLVSPEEE